MRHPQIAAFALVVGLSTSAFGEDPSVAPDNSVSSMDFISQGMPAYDRVWTTSDLKEAVDTLKATAAKDPTLLPRRGSLKSGQLFDRIISQENLASINVAPGLLQKLGFAGSFLQSYGNLFIIYGTASSKEHTYDAEIVDIATMVLEAMSDALEIVDQNYPTMADTDPQKEKLSAYKQRIQKGLATTMGGLLFVLADHSDMRTSELTRLAYAIRPYVLRQYYNIQTGTLQEMKTKIQGLIATETDSSYTEALKQLETSLPE